tara:strand:- start:613 stop:1812 length:1200 start_codon:yes stop_codon:yes gene_type:complete
MTDFNNILLLILEKNPSRLLINPLSKSIIAGFGNNKVVKLSDFSNFIDFKEEIKSQLYKDKIGFGSLFFDIENKKISELWKDFEVAEFTFSNIVLKYENENISYYGEDESLISYFDDIQSKNMKFSKNSENLFLEKNNFESWINLVDKAKNQINVSTLEKIVVAQLYRSKIEKLDLKNTIINMVEKYNNCTTFMYQIKDSIFFGSTPEKIFEYSNKTLKTEAIAGSIPNKGESTEEIKRKFMNTTLVEEHKIVSNYIEKQLMKITSNKVRKSSLDVMKLNNINHLQSKIEVDINDNDFFKFIELLHPSPALAGFPVQEAKNWIRDNENFERGLYTGSIGYVDENNSKFYAALRCAMYKKNEGEIISFAGNGIVRDSKVNYEIEELNSKFKAINESIVKK